MQIIISFTSGLILSAGLMVSGMINPQKVIGFLDIFGTFDPTLGFVMAGALVVAILGYRWAGYCSKPILCDSFSMAAKTKIDAPLIYGSAVFGIGWGLAGFCPAPAIVGLGLGVEKAFIFALAMLAGMCLAKVLKSSNKF